MSNDYQISQGYGNPASIHSLLNEAFEGWGDEEFLEWKLDDYPRFEDEHVFTIWEGDELVACRVLYKKRFENKEGEPLRFFVGADSCVAEEYRGRGLFSDLLNHTRSYIGGLDIPVSTSFNRKGVITFETKKEKGWNYRELPLFVRILNPEVVIPNYAELALEQHPRVSEIVTSLLDTVPSQLALELLPEIVSTMAVEFASSDVDSKSLTRRLNTSSIHKERDSSFSTRVHTPAELEEVLSNLLGLYDRILNRYQAHFARDETDIRHLLSHPSLVEVIVVEDDGDLVGFAPLALSPDSDVTEVNVLDCLAMNRRVFTELVSTIENRADQLDADIIAMMASSNPGPKWAQVDQQVMMWDREFSQLERDWYIGLYDVV